MTKIYLIRHAEAEGNLYRLAQGQFDSAVTDRGWRQIAALRQRFADIHVDEVYSSDLYRACATARAISEPKNLILHKRRDLREIHVGVWEQRTWGEIARTDPVELEHFNKAMHLLRVQGGELPQDVLQRVLAAIQRIAGENDGKTVAIVSHGAAIRMALCHYQGDTLENLGKYPHGDNTAVSCLEWNRESNTYTLIYRDDNRHLQTPEYLAKEKVRKRATAVEPGLYFRPPRLPEENNILIQIVSVLWSEVYGDRQAFDAEKLLQNILRYTTLLAYREEVPAGEDAEKTEQPVGIVQWDNTGRITLYGILPEFRRKSYGVQLLGQVVYGCRPQGVERLSIARMPGSETFFRDYGFYPDGAYLKKEITIGKDTGKQEFL